MTTTRITPFGHALRHWRTLRRLSQLELASLAGTPPRHVSFLETGRARPSEGMVQRLASALDLPPDEQNALYTAAGFSPAFQERALSDDALAGVQFVIERLLASHAPYPALVVNAWYDVLDLNVGAVALLQGVGLPLPPAGATAPVNLVELLLTALRPAIENHHEVLRDTQQRLRRDVVAHPRDARLAALLKRVTEALDEYHGSHKRSAIASNDSPVLLTRFRTAAGRADTLSVLVNFGGAQDVTVHGLHVELIYPANAASAAILERLGAEITEPQ